MPLPESYIRRLAPPPRGDSSLKCSVTGEPAKYRDPVTGAPYATVEAFRVLRARAAAAGAAGAGGGAPKAGKFFRFFPPKKTTNNAVLVYGSAGLFYLLMIFPREREGLTTFLSLFSEWRTTQERIPGGFGSRSRRRPRPGG